MNTNIKNDIIFLRSYFHINSIPDPIINCIFSLVGKEGFHSFNTNFFITYPDNLNNPIKLDDLKKDQYIINQPINLYMGLDYNNLAFMEQIIIVDCKHRRCSIQMMPYTSTIDYNYSNDGSCSDYDDDQDQYDVDKFKKLGKLSFSIGDVYHCISCYPDIKSSLNSTYDYWDMSNEIGDTLFDYHILGKNNASNKYIKKLNNID
jgi:hypothetical protein